MADNQIMNRIAPGYDELNITQTGSYIANNGVLSYLSLDIDKPGKYWFNLNDVFNGTVGEAGKTLPIMFTRGGQPIPLNGYTVSINGLYPDGETEFHITGALLQSSDAIVNFNFPVGVFDSVGSYQFQFVIDDGNGHKETSHWCVFDVNTNANTLGYSWAQGVNPYDSDYNEWKTKINAQMESLNTTLNGINTTANTIKGSIQNYQDNVNSIVNNALGNVPKLNGNNTYSGANTFGTLSASQVSADNGNFQQLTANNGASFPSGTKLNAPILENNNYDLANGMFPNDGYFLVNLKDQSQNVGGVHAFHITGNYISFKKFRYTPRSGDSETAIMEIHLDCTIPAEANGQIIVTFQPFQLNGVDGTPFVCDGKILQFDSSNNGLRCIGAANTTDDIVNDATMI